MGIDIVTRQDLEIFRLQLLDDLKQVLNQEKPNQKKWMRSKEVRGLLNISPGTLQNLRIRGSLHPRKIGSIYYYMASEIDELLVKK